MLRAPQRALRLLECALIMFVAPSVLFLWNPKRLLIPIIIASAVAALILVLTDPTFDRRSLWRGEMLARGVRGLVWIVPLGAAILIAWVLVTQPEAFLSFPRRNPKLYVVVMLAYPLLSVYPQELIYRVGFFHRYEPALGRGWPTILVSGLAFGWVHLLFHNWIAVALSTIGGVLFAWTYHRDRSAATAWLEHAVWGCLIFTIGLGTYFYAR